MPDASEFFDPAASSTIVSHGTGTLTSSGYADPGGSPSYPDMTPGPPRKITETSFHSVPSDARPDGGKVWDYGLMPKAGRSGGAPARIGTAMWDAYDNTPPVITPEAQQAVANTGWLGRNIGSPAITGLNVVGKEAAALGTGATAALSELASGGNPRLARDVNTALTVLPVAQAHMPPVGGPVVRPEPKLPPPGAPIVAPPGPVSLPQVTKAVAQATPPSWRTVAPGEEHVPGREYRMNQATGQREVNEGGPTTGPDNLTIPPPPMLPPPSTPPPPREAVPIKTPEDAMRVYKPQIQAAERSDFKLEPKFTNDWLDSLGEHTTTKTPFGKATNPNAPPVEKLIEELRLGANAPLENIQSIQEAEAKIHRAITEQSGPNGDPTQVRQMRQVLQDFRDRYENVSSDQHTGSPEGLEAYRNSVKSYAAVSRLREVQGIIDGTEGNANRANLIASRTNAFLNDKRNIKGWSDAEIDAVRKAADAGYLSELLRTYASRLSGIGAFAVGGLPAAAVNVPLQVGLAYGTRNMAENARIAGLQRAMGVLGQRVPQPGTVPATRVGPTPPQYMVSGARYAPLVGLLGETQDQPRNQ